jgi:hypothetical protein
LTAAFRETESGAASWTVICGFVVTRSDISHLVFSHRWAEHSWIRRLSRKGSER